MPRPRVHSHPEALCTKHRFRRSLHPWLFWRKRPRFSSGRPRWLLLRIHSRRLPPRLEPSIRTPGAIMMAPVGESGRPVDHSRRTRLSGRSSTRASAKDCRMAGMASMAIQTSAGLSFQYSCFAKEAKPRIFFHGTSG